MSGLDIGVLNNLPDGPLDDGEMTHPAVGDMTLP